MQKNIISLDLQIRAVLHLSVESNKAITLVLVLLGFEIDYLVINWVGFGFMTLD